MFDPALPVRPPTRLVERLPELSVVHARVVLAIAVLARLRLGALLDGVAAAVSILALLVRRRTVGELILPVGSDIEASTVLVVAVYAWCSFGSSLDCGGLS